MRCPSCGNKIARRDRFCGNCGARLVQQPVAAKPKKPLLPRLSPQHLQVAGAVLVGVLALIVLLVIIFPRGGNRKSVPRPTNLGAELTARQLSKGRAEIATKAIYGKVISLQRGSLIIQSIPEGKTYTVYVGRRTNYEPRRYPAIGEKVKVLYIDDRGSMKATQVEIQP
jgi:zinc-ribbon domain